MNASNSNPMPPPGDENKRPLYNNPYHSAASHKKANNSPKDVVAATSDSATPMELEAPRQQQQQQQQQHHLPQEEENRLLDLLKRDYEALHKKSVKDCLRSKHLPCPEVQSLLEQQQQQQEHNKNLVTLSTLQKAYQRVVKDDNEYKLGSLLLRQSQSKEQSSLWYMSRIGVSVRLIQLLLHNSEQNQQQETTVMIGGLLHAISSAAGESLKEWKSESSSSCCEEEQQEQELDLYHGPVSESFHAPQVACFAFSFLLRIKSLFLKQRPDLVSGLWKFLDPMAQELVQTKNNDNNNVLPLELVQDAVQALCGYLKEFRQPALGILSSLMTTNQHQQQSASCTLPPQQIKLCLFFFARLSNFLELSESTRVSSSSSSVEQLDPSIVQDILRMLLPFQGLVLAAQAKLSSNHDATAAGGVLNPLQKIVAKAEKCLVSLLLVDEEDPSTDGSTVVLPNKANLELLLRLEEEEDNVAEADNDVTTTSHLAKAAFRLGKVQIILHILKRMVRPDAATTNNETGIPEIWKDEANVDTLLELSEYLIFVGLPLCHDSLVGHYLDHVTNKDQHHREALDRLLQDALFSISSILYDCEIMAPCMTTNADRGAASLHRMLVRWLLSDTLDCESVEGKVPAHHHHHPLTRQLVLVLLQMHSVRLHTNAANENNAVGEMPVISLLVNLFFDARTRSEHRATIAVFLRTIFASESQSQQFVQSVQHLVCTEYNNKRPKSPRKWKRPKTEAKANTKSEQRDDHQNQGWNQISLEDMQTIGTVLSHLPVSMIGNANHDVERFWFDVVRCSNEISKRKTRKLKTGSVKMAIVCLAFLESSVREDLGQGALKSMTGGQDLFAVLEQVVCWFLGKWNAEFADGQRNHADQGCMKKLSVLGTAILRLVAFSCEQAGHRSNDASSSVGAADNQMSHKQMESLYKLLDTCTDEIRVLRLFATSSTAIPVSNPSCSALVLEASRVLSVVGPVIPSDGPDDILRGLFGLFKRLLGSNICWSLVAYTISSLHSFSTTLPRAHKSQLPTSIPKRKRKGLLALLQCRAQGSVYRYDQHSKQKISAFGSTGPLHTYCSTKLESLVCRTSRVKALKKSSSETVLTIEVGSYFLTMPTQDGRKAVVVFPPVEASLQDIHYMLGAEEEDGGDAEESSPNIQQLHRVHLAPDGSSNMVLKSSS